jgi:tetratricopeptide (TPR) repeat protein
MSFSPAFLGRWRAAAGLIRRADRARDVGPHAEAAELYSRALDLIPARADIRVQLGHMLREVGRYQAAQAAYSRVLSRSPDEGDIHLNLGHLLKLAGRNKEAITAYRDAARLLPDNRAPLTELSALGVTEKAPTQSPPHKTCEAHIRDGDCWRDARDYAGAMGLQSCWSRPATTCASMATCRRTPGGCKRRRRYIDRRWRALRPTPISISSSVIP